MYREELLNLVSGWSLEQLTTYINELETRVTETSALIKELRQLQKRKTRRKVYDNGPRDGR